MDEYCAEKRITTVKRTDQRETEKKGRGFARVFAGTVYALTAVVIIAWIASYWFPVMKVTGNGMSPTLEAGEIVIAIRDAQWQTGDLLLFYNNDKLLVKRVVAGPGDEVEIDEGGTVYVNGAALQEPYVSAPARGDCDMDFPLKVSDERWFVLGDKRDISIDSRNTQIGFIADEQIIGRVVARVWPLEKIELIASVDAGKREE